MKKVLTTLLTAVMLSVFAMGASAQRTISGVIISSEDGEPVIGASVTVSETQLKKAGSTAKVLGAVTDIDGVFRFTIPSKVTEIEIRSIGFTPRTIHLVDGVDDYDLKLDPASEVLGDVVVTGYQVIEKRKLTAAITKTQYRRCRHRLGDEYRPGARRPDCRSVGGAKLRFARSTP